MDNNKKNIVIAVLITLIVCMIIGFCVFLICNASDKVNSDKNGEVVNKNTKTKEDLKVDDQSDTNSSNEEKNADINKSVLMNLYDNKVTNSTNVRDVIKQDIDYTLNYGTVNNHNLKIRIYIKDTGKTSEYDQDNKKYINTFDIYVDDNKYNVVDGEVYYVYHTGIGELLENIKIEVNKIGIVIINERELTGVDSATEAFILIYGKNNEFKYIDGITTKYSTKTDPTTNYGWDLNNLQKEPIQVYDDYITYCKYDKELEKENWETGKNNVNCVKYDGKTETTYREEKDAYIHQPLV